MQFIYFVIPTCCGEIMGFPSIFTNVHDVINYPKESTIYKIDLFNQLITEVEVYDL